MRPPEPLSCLLVGRRVQHCSWQRGLLSFDWMCTRPAYNNQLLFGPNSMWSCVCPQINCLFKWSWEPRRKVSPLSAPSLLRCSCLRWRVESAPAWHMGKEQGLCWIEPTRVVVLLPGRRGWRPSKWGLLLSVRVSTFALPAVWQLQLRMEEHFKKLLSYAGTAIQSVQRAKADHIWARLLAGCVVAWCSFPLPPLQCFIMLVWKW